MGKVFQLSWIDDMCDLMCGSPEIDYEEEEYGTDYGSEDRGQQGGGIAGF